MEEKISPINIKNEIEDTGNQHDNKNDVGLHSVRYFDEKRENGTVGVFIGIKEEPVDFYDTKEDDSLNTTEHSKDGSSGSCVSQEGIKEAVDSCIQIKQEPLDLTNFESYPCNPSSEKQAFTNQPPKIPEDTSEKPFKCTMCPYEAFSKFTLKRHKLTHTKPKIFKCSDCNYITNRKDCLGEHMLKHNETKLLKCPECNYETNWKRSLRTHMIKHNETKMLRCSECSYKTNYRWNLRLHVIKHNDEEMLKCQHCSYKTNRKDNFRVHMIKHDDKNTLKCLVCNFETNRKDSFKAHMAKHDKKLLKCTECNYKTNLQTKLSIHMAKHIQYQTALLEQSTRHFLDC